MTGGDPVGLPQIAALALGWFAFLIALFVAGQRRTAEARRSGQRSGWSVIGIVVQGLGIGLAGFGPIRVALDPLSAPALGAAAVVLLLMAATVWLFAASTRAMGRNWALVARTRSDHALVTAGPFAHIRHPIYTGLFLMMLALAVALGHLRHLLFTVPLFAIGTAIRVREEERLLRKMFGAEYDAYAARVKRFIPGMFWRVRG